MIQLRKIKNKRADMTLNMVVKTVLSVLSIVVLIYLAGSLYGIFTKKSKLEQARASLDQLINEINWLEESIGREYLITSPVKWILVFNEKELCICEEKYGDDYTSCCNDGVSQNIENVIIEDSCVIDTGVFTRGGIMQECIHLKPLPKKIYLDKEGEKISLTSNKITGVLDEFWNYEFEGVVIGELFKSGVVASGIIGERKTKLKEAIHSYFQKKNQDYLVEVNLVSPSKNVFSTGNHRLGKSEGFTYEFVRGDYAYMLIARYKENV